MHVSDYNNYIRKYGKVISKIKSIRVVSLTTEIMKWKGEKRIIHTSNKPTRDFLDFLIGSRKIGPLIDLCQWFSTGVDFAHRGTFGNIWTHSGLSSLGEGHTTGT